jgi:shikimate dehydrogenase
MDNLASMYAQVLIVGAGGVGSAIAASLAEAGVRRIALHDDNKAALKGNRLNTYYLTTEVAVGSTDPAGFDIVVNATPLGMRTDDPLPIDVSRCLPPRSWAKSS